MKCAFAIHAKGEMYSRFRKNLVAKLNMYVPGIDIVDIDREEALKFFAGMPGGIAKEQCLRLAIPLMHQFEKYDRVIWLDCDIDITSGEFSLILDCETGEDGISMAVDFYDKEGNDRMVNYMKKAFPSFDKRLYFNSGVIVMDLAKIDRNKLGDCIRGVVARRTKCPGQDVLNYHFNAHELDPAFNYIWKRRKIYPRQTKPLAVHYITLKSELYDRLQTEDNGGVPPVDAVFVIGSGSRHANEELRYALRNLDENCAFVRNVYICGECPEWVDVSKVRHLKWPDRFRHAKDANIIDKLLHACRQHGMSKQILFCSDDQFQTRKCTWDDFSPMYVRTYKSGDRWVDEKSGGWFKFLKGTLEREIERRKRLGIGVDSVYYYEPHIWTQIDRDKFVAYAKWSEYEKSKYTIIMSGYFNFINPKTKPNRGSHYFLRGDETALPDVCHIAYTDGTSYDAAMRFLRAMFPNRCRFELPKSVMAENSKMEYLRSIRDAFARRIS